MRVWKPSASIEVTWQSSLYTESLSSYIAATGADPANSDFSSVDLGDDIIRRQVYITVSGDLDPVGNYQTQAYVEMPSWKGRGGTFNWDVIANFN